MTSIYKICPILLLLMGFSWFSQAQKCKLEKNDVDALTELAIKRTTQELLTRVNNEPIYIKAQCIGANKYLKLSYYSYGNFSFKEEREIKLITTLNDEITLYPRIVPVDTTKMNNGYSYHSLITYKLSPKQYTTLTASGVVSFKYYVTTGWVDAVIKPSKQLVIQNILKCVE